MRGPLLFALVLTSALGVIVACSSESKPPPAAAPTVFTPGSGGGGGSSSGEGGANVDAGGDRGGGPCNKIANTGLVVDALNVQGDPPSQQGGTIVDGAYDITDVKYYVGAGGVSGPAGVSWKGSISIAKGRLDRIYETKDLGTGATNDAVETFTLFVPDSGTTVQIALSCPVSGASIAEPYTASPTQLTLVDSVRKIAVTYTHR